MTPLGLTFRGFHLVLHIATVVMILTGFCKFPDNIDGDSKSRAIAWLCFECLYLLISLSIFVYSLCPKCFSKIHSSDKSKDPTASNFFFYVLMSTFVIYASMIGCHVPNLFINLNGKRGPFQSWQICMIPATVIGVVNALIYFITALIPIEKKTIKDATPQASASNISMMGTEGTDVADGGQGSTDNAKAIGDDDEFQDY